VIYRLNLSARLSLSACLLSAFLLSQQTTPAIAQAPAVTPPVAKPAAPRIYAPLPAGMTAEKILDRAFAASGGQESLAKTKTTYQKGNISVGAQGIKGVFEVYIKRPNKFYTAQTFEGIGKTEVAYDGKIAWSKDPINGVRTMKDKEKAQLQRQIDNDANRGGDWRKSYSKIEALGVRKVEGKDAYAIRLTPTNGKPLVQYFDTQTNLMVRMDMISEGPQGTLPIESYFSDYRTVDGMKIPFQMRQKVAATELLTTVTEIKNNLPVTDAKFAKPE
jgi:outer membrane lipoprotein-sorting protein